jgi:hypothetical protein
MLDFEVLIDASLISVCENKLLSPIDKKYVLSIINDFEDNKWRYRKFQNFIWDNIAETALTQRERQALINQSHTMLSEAAQKLRLTDKSDDISQGSEIAEIVLYGIMRNHYGALPIVPKIFNKQNPNDTAKGVDSVHILVEHGNDFSLWFGEAKFYNSIDDTRLPEILQSVDNSLKTDKLKKENSIITNIRELDDLEIDNDIKESIKMMLSHKESIDILKPKLHIPILLLHECEKTQETLSITDKYKQEIIAYHKERAISYFGKQIKRLGAIPYYSEISFHLILFPVPFKRPIIDSFIQQAETYRAG